ncbi:MAG: hypothetical protein HKN09_03095 [Saprospiraceae bacterium]|nr:hypothetical protein [Saprospiraceae bacterium]
MSAQSHDDINKIFQSKLKDTDSGDGYWNIPPDRVFDEAMIDVAAMRKARRNRRRRIGALLLLLIGLTTVGWLLNNHINQLNARIHQLETQVEIYAESKSKTSDEVVLAQSNVITVKSGKEMELEESVFINQNNTPTNSNSAAKVLDDVAVTNPGSEQKSFNHESEPVNYIPLVTSNLTPELLWIQEIDTPEHSVSYRRSVPELFLTWSEASGPDKEELNNGITLALIPTTFISWARMDNIMPESYALTKYGDLRSSYGLQLSGAIPLNKSLSVTGGLALSSIRNRSLLNDQFEYDLDNQYSNNNGLQMYSSNIEIVTPLGIHENVTSFDVSNFSLQDGSTIENRTQLDQSIRIVSFHTGLRNSFKVSDRISAFAGVGLSYSIIENYCSDMLMQLYDGTDMIDEFDIHTEDGSALNNNFFSLNGELGLNLSLGRNWGISLIGSYSKGMSDLTRGPSQTYFDNIGIGTGIYLKI